jgi:hypothetical protein
MITTAVLIVSLLIKKPGYPEGDPVGGSSRLLVINEGSSDNIEAEET